MKSIMNNKLNRTWAEIDLDALAHNVREVRRIINKATEIMGVVKADAYGHGVKEVARAFLDNGITRLAVAVLDEALQLRRLGIDAPILVLGYSDPARSDEIILNEVTQTIFSYDSAKALSDSAVKLNRNVKIHAKVDTGMTRVGFTTDNRDAKIILEISKLPGIIMEGIFTHFASADEKDRSYTQMQFEKFMCICGKLSGEGLHIPFKHVCNSAGALEFPEMHLDMVRPGIILYGLYPSMDADRQKIALKPAMTLKSNVILVKTVEKGTCIGYGRGFKTLRRSRVATIPIGYGDGYTRLLSNKGHVLIHGKSVPVVGRICMDQCMIDLTDMKKKVFVGDEVILFGRQGEAELNVEQVATDIGTINYEVVCMIGKRIPRVYLKDGKIDNILNYLL